MVSYYANRAQEYDRIYQKPERQDDLRWLRDFVERRFAGMPVFEVACGTGYWTERVVFIDNAYVEGSSTPISRTDEHGDTYQVRRLDDGSQHEVLKNFPSEPELRATVEGLATGVQVDFLRYYWILSYASRVDV